MDKKSLGTIGILLMGVMGIAFYFFYDNSPPLPNQLATIQCSPNHTPADKNPYTLSQFTDYSLFTLCLDSRQASDKGSLKCDESVTPRSCDEKTLVLNQFYSKFSDGRVTASYETNEPRPITQVNFRFSQSPFSKKNVPRFGTPYDITSQLTIPSKFQVTENFVCDDVITVLHTASCMGRLKYKSVEILVMSDILGQEGERINEKTFIKENNQWLELLNNLLVDKK